MYYPPSMNNPVQNNNRYVRPFTAMMDSPPPLHNLSLNPSPAFPQSYFPWDYGRRCGYISFLLN